jgi:hypothetical protein
MPTTDRDVWDWLISCGGLYTQGCRVYAVLEQQSPRPTNIFDRKVGQYRATILKSTCVLYGNYTLLRGMLCAAGAVHGVVLEDCPPKRWQQFLKIPPRDKGEKESAWKSRLKQRAQQTFPSLRVTLHTADALLLCEYARRRYLVLRGGLN